MQQGFNAKHLYDDDQKPCGGWAVGNGFTIVWQDGPLMVEGRRVPPTGAFIEDVIAAVMDRLQFHQGTEFACAENAAALGHLSNALDALRLRTIRREKQGIEGTHTPDPKSDLLPRPHTFQSCRDQADVNMTKATQIAQFLQLPTPVWDGVGVADDPMDVHGRQLAITGGVLSSIEQRLHNPMGEYGKDRIPEAQANKQ